MTMTVQMMSPQNFSIPAGYNEIITFDVNPEVTPSLVGTTIWWRLYKEQFGIRVIGSPPILEKSTDDTSPPSISALDSPLSFMVQMFTVDTIDILHNYYHEATILNAANQVIGGSFGIMTVLATENR